MTEVSKDHFKQTVELHHGGTATFIQAVPVNESFREQSAWHGVVHIFDLKGGPSGANRAYAWSHTIDDSSAKRRFYAVLHGANNRACRGRQGGYSGGSKVGEVNQLVILPFTNPPQANSPLAGCLKHTKLPIQRACGTRLDSRIEGCPMRCNLMNDGHIAAVELLENAPDDAAALFEATAIFIGHTGNYDGFEVWDDARLIFRSLDLRAT